MVPAVLYGPNARSFPFRLFQALKGIEIYGRGKQAHNLSIEGSRRPYEKGIDPGGSSPYGTQAFSYVDFYEVPWIIPLWCLFPLSP